ncbi:TIGR02391 family protein [Clostridium botulinum]
MGKIIRKMSNSELEALSRALGEGCTGSELTMILNDCGIRDNSGESTKWRRIFAVFTDRQEQDGNSNAFLLFIQKSLAPVRFINMNHNQYEELLFNVNRVLMFMGLEISKEGKIGLVNVATTITEVERRTQNLKRELEKRVIHKDVLACCKVEYLQENYFHAIFEAAKSLSEKVRNFTGIKEDGSALFNTAFSVSNPRLALNSLQTSSERNQQNGLKEMLHGVTHMVRNVTAHEMKYKWILNEQDAIDILTTISFLHKQLDECIMVPQI